MQPSEQAIGKLDYHVIPRNLIFITNNDAILLLKGAPSKRRWANKYNGIGGHIKAGESPLQSAHRELLEEANLKVNQLDLRAIIHITMPKPPGVVLFVYTGESKSRSVSASEEGTPEWVPMERYMNYDLVEDLYFLLPKILAPGPLFYSTYVIDENGLHIGSE